MVVAVIPVRVVQVTVDEIVDVIAVRNGFVAATGAVYVRSIMSAASVIRCAVGRVLTTDFDLVLVDVVAVHVVQVTVMQVVHVAVVLHRGMTAVGTMGVVVVRVFFTAHLILHFTGVFDHALDQLGDVRIGERVVLVFALALAGEQPFCSQDPQSSRDRGKRIPRQRGQLRHAAFARRQQLEQA